METYKDKTAVVHGQKDLLKFLLGGHHLIVAVLFPVSVKGLGGVHNQGVEEYMGYLVWIDPYQSGFGGLVLSDGCGYLLVILYGLIFGEESDGSVIVIAGSQKLCLLKLGGKFLLWRERRFRRLCLSLRAASCF